MIYIGGEQTAGSGTLYENNQGCGEDHVHEVFPALPPPLGTGEAKYWVVVDTHDDPPCGWCKIGTRAFDNTKKNTGPIKKIVSDEPSIYDAGIKSNILSRITDENLVPILGGVMR